ncbi:MAG: nucleotide exchange factor GrpE [Pseudanabaenaceae cyanobacterium]
MNENEPILEETLSNLEEIQDDDNIDLEASLQELAAAAAASPADPETVAVGEAPPFSIDNNALLREAAAREIESLQQKIETLVAETVSLKSSLEERQGQYARLYADFENFRKRTQREKEEEEERITGKLLKKFLPVVDDFERAKLQIEPKTDGEASIHNSYQSVYRQIVKCLQEAGIHRMEVLGQPFDPNLHEAIAQEISETYAEGHIIEEFRPGYTIGEKVLRHALVKVAAPGSAPPT